MPILGKILTAVMGTVVPFLVSDVLRHHTVAPPVIRTPAWLAQHARHRQAHAHPPPSSTTTSPPTTSATGKAGTSADAGSSTALKASASASSSNPDLDPDVHDHGCLRFIFEPTMLGVQALGLAAETAVEQIRS
jgi:hypothetical protein